MDLDGLDGRPWRVVEDAFGRRILEWADETGAAAGDAMLERLDTRGLTLAEDAQVVQGYDPYDSGVFSIEGSAFYNRSRGKRSAFARTQRSK